MLLAKRRHPAKTEEILTEAAEKNKNNPENLADIVFAFLQFRNIDKANMNTFRDYNNFPETIPKFKK
jgi:hypothetical protein